MAANWKSTQGIIKQIWTVNYSSSRFVLAPASASPAVRRAAHSSSYDKNFDDQLRPSVVPDDVIQPLSDKYWAPHPQTGVFGPATEQNSAEGGGRAISTSPANGGHSVVLEEEKAWFRPTSLEDLEKPHHI